VSIYLGRVEPVGNGQAAARARTLLVFDNALVLVRTNSLPERSESREPALTGAGRPTVEASPQAAADDMPRRLFGWTPEELASLRPDGWILPVDSVDLATIDRGFEGREVLTIRHGDKAKEISWESERVDRGAVVDLLGGVLGDRLTNRITSDKVPLRVLARIPVWLAAVGIGIVLATSVPAVMSAWRRYTRNHQLRTQGVSVQGQVVDKDTMSDWTHNRVEVHYTAEGRDYTRWIGTRTPDSNLPSVGDSVQLLFVRGHPTNVAIDDLISDSGCIPAIVFGTIAIALCLLVGVRAAIAVRESTAARRRSVLLPAWATIVLAVAAGAAALAYWQAGLTGAGGSSDGGGD
jgi:hypothetical protein